MARRLHIVREHPPVIESPLMIPTVILICVGMMVAYILTMTPPIFLHNDDIDALVVEPGIAAAIKTMSPTMISIIFDATKQPLVLQVPTDGRIRGALVEMCYGPSCTLLLEWKGQQMSWHLPIGRGILVFSPLSEYLESSKTVGSSDNGVRTPLAHTTL